MHPDFTFDQLEFYDCKSLNPILNNLKKKKKEYITKPKENLDLGR